jgi:hypothetical protein
VRKGEQNKNMVGKKVRKREQGNNKVEIKQGVEMQRVGKMERGRNTTEFRRTW